MFINRSVLLADDQSTVRADLHEILRRTGCTVVAETGNTDDTLDRFDRLRPDIVIIDVTLPGTYDALVTIQRMARMSPASAIFATGMASQSAVVMEALSMGAVDFFLKPFQQGTIRLSLQRNLVPG
jgi:two-component system chemotaxis response regulator CheY